MILLITTTGERYTLVNVTRIEERRTRARTLIEPFVRTNLEGEGEIDLSTTQVTLLPEATP